MYRRLLEKIPVGLETNCARDPLRITHRLDYQRETLVKYVLARWKVCYAGAFLGVDADILHREDLTVEEPSRAAGRPFNSNSTFAEPAVELG
jgi:hypothetical protein